MTLNVINYWWGCNLVLLYVLNVPISLKILSHFNPVVSLPGIYPKEKIGNFNTFIIVTNWKKN